MEDRVRIVLNTMYPDEVDVLGEDAVAEIVQSQSDPSHLDLQGGDKFDIAPVYNILSSAAKVIKKLINDYDDWKIKHASVAFTFKAKDYEFILNGADPATKEAIIANIPRFIAIMEAGTAQSATE